MSLADHLAPPPSQCRTCAWYNALPADERAIFDGHLAAGGSVRALHRAATTEGLAVVRSAFADHVRQHHHGTS